MTSSTKRVSPAILQPLKEALTLAYWYKPDLRAFLVSSLGDRQLIAQLDWAGDYKRTIVAQLVDSLASQQHTYFDQLLSLILATADITDPSWLKRVDNGDEKYAAAVAALKTLRDQVEPYRRIRNAEEEAARRREAERASKWRNDKSAPSDLDSFAGKIGRKLDNTLGLFLSMNGFQQSAVDLHSQGRSVMILMDGSDLSAVMDGRIELPELLKRKRQHAARTGGIYLGAYTIIS